MSHLHFTLLGETEDDGHGPDCHGQLPLSSLGMVMGQIAMTISLSLSWEWEEG